MSSGYPKTITERAIVWRMLKRLDGGKGPLFKFWLEFGDDICPMDKEDELHTLGLEDDEYWALLKIRTDARMRHLDRAQRDGLLADCGSPEGLHALLYAELKPDDEEQ